MKTSKLEQKLNALQNRLNRYISKSVKASRSMILDLIFQIAKLERMIEFLAEKTTLQLQCTIEVPHEEGENYGEEIGFFEEYALLAENQETRKFYEQAQKMIDDVNNNPINKLISSIESERMTTKRWTNYGKDRLYVTMPNGIQMGFIDLLKKKLIVTYSKCGKFDGIVENLIETYL